MDFGAVTKDELDKIDFTLPQEPQINATILSGKPTTLKKVYVGCPQWGVKEWVGKIYPPKTKANDFLQVYTQLYNCIELNATHYNLYGESGLAKWKEKAEGRDFLFCPKMYKGITHSGKLPGNEFVKNEFLRGIAGFANHLGPVFIQLHEKFSPSRKHELFQFLESLPDTVQFFVEVRNAGWFSPALIEELTTELSKQKIGLVITDSAGRRDCVHMHLPVAKTFIRFVGNSLHPTDFTRIEAWAKRIHYWLDNGIEEVIFIVHSGEVEASPAMTKFVVDTFNKECGLDIPEIKMLSRPTLF